MSCLKVAAWEATKHICGIGNKDRSTYSTQLWNRCKAQSDTASEKAVTDTEKRRHAIQDGAVPGRRNGGYR